jgi:hypothetical protein
MQTLIALGQYAAAIPLAEELISVPSMLHRNLLRADPTYEPLKLDPRFRRLIGG